MGVTRTLVALSAIFATAVLIPQFTQNEKSPNIEPPQLIAGPGQQKWFSPSSLRHNTTLTLTCEAIGKPLQFGFWWEKNKNWLHVDHHHIQWVNFGQSGTIVIKMLHENDAGRYQCFARNALGTVMSTTVHAKAAVLGYFPAPNKIRTMVVDLLQPLSLYCKAPYGVPKPTVFWLNRNKKRIDIIDVVDRNHVTSTYTTSNDSQPDGFWSLNFPYVDLIDAINDNLYQCASRSAAIKGEYRLGPMTRLVLSNKTYEHYHRRLFVYRSPTNSTVVVGQQLKLTCVVSGYPHAAPKWARQLTEYIPRKWQSFDELANLSNNNNTMIIDHVSLFDEAVYECSFGNLKHQMNVTVVAAPVWEVTPPNKAVFYEESNIELICSAQGQPQPSYQWYFNGAPLNINTSDGAMHFGNNKILRIAKVHPVKHTGVYQCNASNSYGYVFANIFVDVTAFAPFFVTPLNRTLHVIRGRRIEIQCNATGAPIPQVYFYDTRNDGLGLGFATNTLHILKARHSDSGLYTCTAENKYGRVTANTTLYVYEPAVWQQIPVPGHGAARFAKAFESFTVPCVLNVDSRLTVQYRWLKDGHPFNDTNVYSTTTGLEFKNVRRRHSGYYECIAKTVFETKRTELYLIISDVPHAPVLKNVTCFIHNNRNAFIQFKRSIQNRDPITAYVVQYSTGFNETNWIDAKVVHTKASHNTDHVYEAIVPLSAFTSYRFRVIAKNTYGDSEPGYLDAPCRTWPARPDVNPTNVTFSTNGHGTLLVSWKPLPMEEWNANSFKYFIRYRPKNSNKPWIELDVAPSKNQVLLRDLPGFIEFEVQVGSKNVVGRTVFEPKTFETFTGDHGNGTTLTPNVNASSRLISMKPLPLFIFLILCFTLDCHCSL